jgi:hypothetical protein
MPFWSRVTRAPSRYSSNGMACLRVRPVRALKRPTSKGRLGGLLRVEIGRGHDQVRGLRPVRGHLPCLLPALLRQFHKRKYGKADNDLQNPFALSLNYELQYGKKFTGVKKAFLSGWATNMIVVWQSGKPLSVIESGQGADTPLDSGPTAPTPKHTATPIGLSRATVAARIVPIRLWIPA